jgi:hypothetical protein
MAAEFTLYNSFLEYANDGTIDLLTDGIKVALVTSVYTPDLTHQVLADVKTSPDPEVWEVVSPDNGYHEGGATLAGRLSSILIRQFLLPSMRLISHGRRSRRYSDMGLCIQM